MKVKLTNRKNVFAEGPFFNVGVTETAVTIRAPFGAVIVRRTKKGLEVNLEPMNPKEQVVQLNPSNVVAIDKTDNGYVADTVTATLRPMGQFTMGEMDDPAIRKLVELWMNKGK